MKTPHFRQLLPGDGTQPLLALYRRAIAGIDDGLYTEPEKELWMEWADTPRVADRILREGITLLAEREGQLQGFAQLTPGPLINMLYVDPGHGRQGVGMALIHAMETIARHRGAERLHTRASHASRPLFQRAGFVVEGAANDTRAVAGLGRTTMVRTLGVNRR